MCSFKLYMAGHGLKRNLDFCDLFLDVFTPVSLGPSYDIHKSQPFLYRPNTPIVENFDRNQANMA